MFPIADRIVNLRVISIAAKTLHGHVTHVTVVTLCTRVRLLPPVRGKNTARRSAKHSGGSGHPSELPTTGGVIKPDPATGYPDCHAVMCNTDSRQRRRANNLVRSAAALGTASSDKTRELIVPI